jgi:WD40 repeat protein
MGRASHMEVDRRAGDVSPPVMPMCRMTVCFILVFASALPSAEPARRLDAYGDPLPEGAIARLGTLRYRPGSANGAFALSPDGKLIATGEMFRLRLWDTATGKEVRAIELADAVIVQALQFSEDSKRLAACVDHQWLISRGPFEDESIYTIDIETGKVLFRVREPRVGYRQFELTPDGKHLVARYGGRPEVDSEKEDTAHVWDVATGKEVNRLPPAECFAVSPDSKAVALGKTNGTIEICDLITGKASARLKGHGDPVHALVFARDGRLLASASGVRERPGSEKKVNDRSIRIWDVAQGKQVQRCWGHDGTLGSLRFTADNRFLKATDERGKPCLWNVATGKEVPGIFGRAGPVDPVSDESREEWACALSPDGKTLVWCGHSGVFHEWDLAAGKERRTWGGQQGCTTTVAFTPDGKRLVAQGSGITVWNVAAAEEVREFEAHRGELLALKFSADGRFLASADDGRGLRLWDAATGKPLPPFGASRRETVLRFEFSADSKLLTTVGTDAVVRVWDPASGWLTRHLDLGGQNTLKHWAHVEGKSVLDFQDRARSPVAFDPSGRRLAVSGADQVIHLWDVSTGRIGELRGHRAQLDQVVFAPGGKHLFSLDWAWRGPLIQARSLRLWDLDRLQQVHEWRTNSLAGVAQSPDGSLLALSGAKSVKLWELPACKLLCELPTVADDLAFDRTGKTLASWTREQSTIRTWDTRTGQALRAFSGKERWEYSALSFEAVANDKLLARASLDGKHSNWGLLDLATGRQIAMLPGWQGRHAVSPDGRLVAVSAETVKLHEWASGAVIGELPSGHRGDVNVIAFSPDSKRLATGGADTTILLWDWAQAAGITSKLPSTATLDDLWVDLADADAAKAYRAVFALAANDKSAAFVRDRLKPATTRDAEPIRTLLANLDAGRFEAREKAFQELVKLGAEAEPLVREALAKKPPLEMARRLEAILARPESSRWPAESLRKMRAVHALELAATSEARQVLEALAAGSADAWLTREAKHALPRLR